MTAQNTRIGLLYALCGFALLSVGDAVVKSMAGQWSPIAIAALRFTLGAIVLSGLMGAKEGAAAFKPRKPWLQAFRGFCLASATICFFTAIFFMPLAEAAALTFVAPIFTAILGGPILKERTTPATWGASLLAFAGVLLVLRPNLLEVGLVAFLPLGAALFASMMMIANRASAGQGSTLSMQVFIAGFATPLLIVAAFVGRLSRVEVLAFGWPDPIVIGKCAIVALTATSAHWLIFMGTSRASASSVAPMTYVQLLVTLLLGWLWFGDVPDLIALLGALIIVGAGLLLWWSARTKAPPISD